MSDPLGTVGPCPVNSHNEWDPLEEVIVGRLEGAVIPSPHITVTRNVPPGAAKLYRRGCDGGAMRPIGRFVKAGF